MANLAVSIGYGHNIGRALPRYPLSIQKVYNKYTNGYRKSIQKGIQGVFFPEPLVGKKGSKSYSMLDDVC